MKDIDRNKIDWTRLEKLLDEFDHIGQRNKLEDITAKCAVAFKFVGPFLDDLANYEPDVQIALTDVLGKSVELRLKCARLLALNRLDNLPVTEISAQWEELCTSISFIGTSLAPALGERMDAVL